jgi:hypothetical protein
MNAVRRTRRPRYADVVATLALLMALSGTAYAVTALPARSVGAKQLKSRAVTNSKIATRAVSSAKIGAGAVTGTNLATAAVSTAKLANGSVTAAKLTAASVGHVHLAANAVEGTDVADESLSLSDLVGADVSGTISFSIAGNACTAINTAVHGAIVGQVAQIGFTGDTPIPNGLVVASLKVTAPDNVVLRMCAVGAGSISVSDLGVRIITFG